jgi:hypothetical protein
MRHTPLLTPLWLVLIVAVVKIKGRGPPSGEGTLPTHARKRKEKKGGTAMCKKIQRDDEMKHGGYEYEYDTGGKTKRKRTLKNGVGTHLHTHPLTADRDPHGHDRGGLS